MFSHSFICQPTQLDTLIQLLKCEGYQPLGPKVMDGAIIYGEIHSIADFPKGMTEEQEAGVYRLKKRSDGAYFGFAVGPYSWKKFLFPTERRLWRAKKTKSGFSIKVEAIPKQKLALIGVRACELKGIEIQDQVFLGENYQDPYYRECRKNAFILSVNCSHAGGTCFCVSMKTGPKATSGFDLSLTEISTFQEHYFLVEVGSQKGESILSKLKLDSATQKQIKQAELVIQNTSEQMGRKLEAEDIRDLLKDNLEHSRWDEVADRCLACANCTMVCPTCFCSTVEDTTDLTGDHSERWQRWDSCFTAGFSYLNGAGSVRASTKSRYRQWLTHKLSTWWDQFNSSGCVGCGRCITWCPVGIDLTEEVAALRKSE